MGRCPATGCGRPLTHRQSSAINGLPLLNKNNEPMAEPLHVSARDRQLAPLSMGIGLLFWVTALYAAAHLSGVLLVSLCAGALLVIGIVFLSYLFAHSAFIAHLRGQGIEVNETQLPALQQQLIHCCATLHVDPIPHLYILNGNGVLNAFATWFLARRFVILNSDLVDAMEDHPAGICFYIGHELGHIRRHDNPFYACLRWPALRLPLLGAAFARARETTCDLHGLACCPSRESAARSLAALSAGKRQWAALSLAGMRLQVEAGTGFWMSFHELIASYPWTAKRTVRVLDESPSLPSRNPFAYLLAAFIPYAGSMGAGVGLLIYVYVIGIAAAISIPRYHNAQVLQQLTRADTASAPAREKLVNFYQHNHRVPTTLGEAGIDGAEYAPMPQGAPLYLIYALDRGNMSLSVRIEKTGLLYVPTLNKDGSIQWTCSGLTGVLQEQLPPTCNVSGR